MRPSHRYRGPLGMMAVLTLAATFVLVTEPALAYPGLQIRTAVVDTDNCRVIDGGLQVIPHADSCEIRDSFDGTFFRKDPGGEAVKIQLHDSRGMVAKVEFHPYGEWLWVYDTRDDRDTIYVTFYSHSIGTQGVYRGPVNGYFRTSFDILEGQPVEIYLFDDDYLLKLITEAIGRA